MSLKEYRKQLKLTQADLAYHSRVSAAEISRIETGRLKPSDGQIQRLAKALGVKPDQIAVEK